MVGGDAILLVAVSTSSNQGHDEPRFINYTHIGCVKKTQIFRKKLPSKAWLPCAESSPPAPAAASVTVSVVLRFQYDLTPSVTLLEVSISIPNLGQRVDLCDRDLKPARREQPGELCEHVRRGCLRIPFCLYPMLGSGSEIDDGIDPVFGNT
jgi:hypothetical protein